MTPKPPLVYSCAGCSSAAQHADFDPAQAAELYIREVLPAAGTVVAQRHHASSGKADEAQTADVAHEA